jgi:hypothetical protein
MTIYFNFTLPPTDISMLQQKGIAQRNYGSRLHNLETPRADLNYEVM